MTKTFDLEYIEQGLFTCFVPISKDGEAAWNELAKHTQGTGKVLAVHQKATLSMLRAAGYSVRKAKPIDTKDIDFDKMLNELTDL